MEIHQSKARAAALTMALVSLAACGDGREAGVGEEGEQAPEQALSEAEQAYQAFVQGFMEIGCDSIAPVGNEVHDCQRLVRRPEDFGEQGPPVDSLEFGPLIGILPDTTVMKLDESAYRRPQVVARISNAGSLSAGTEQGYPPLGIGGPPEDAETATFCLWIHVEGEEWRAAIQPTTSPGSLECGEQPNPADPVPWQALAVDRQLYAPATEVDVYPATARWQWTGVDGNRNGVHFIGARCAYGWCAVLPAGETAPPMEQNQPPTRAIAGWYDAQFLGVMRPGPAGDSVLKPGPWGTVYPEPVPPREHPDWQSGIRVARFDLKRAPGGVGFGNYVSKLNAGTSGLSSVVLSWQGDPAQNPSAEYRNSAGGPPASAEVVTGQHPHGTAMSARWRWRETDETAWVPCPYYGCCDVEEGNF